MCTGGGPAATASSGRGSTSSRRREPAAVGPGRAAPGSQQAVTALGVAHLLRDAPARNVLVVAAANSFGGKTEHELMWPEAHIVATTLLAATHS